MLFLCGRTLKRVCVVFRGSVTLYDWLIDGLGFVKWVGFVKWNETIIENDDVVKFHGGFSSKYLYVNTFDSVFSYSIGKTKHLSLSSFFFP